MAAWRPGPATLRRSVEVVLVCLLAAQSARLIWAAVAPVGPLGVPISAQAASMAMPADTSILERFNPFGRTAPVNVALALPSQLPPAATVSLTLYGLRASMSGDGGSAIIAGPDGRQASFNLGEEIAPGVTLRAVRSDHAVVVQNGAPVRLVLGTAASLPPPGAPPSVATGGPAQTGTAPAEAALVVDPAQLMAQTIMVPQRENGRVAGVTVQPRGAGGAALAQAGLRPGDVLLSVNGRALDSAERQSELAQELQGADEAEIRFRRDGLVLTTRLKFSR